MIRAKVLCPLILSCLFSTSSSAFFERTLRFYTGIELRHGTPNATLGNADAAEGNPIQSLAQRLLIQMAPYFIINHQARTDEHVLRAELNRLLDETTLVANGLIQTVEIPAVAETGRPLADLVIAAESGDAGARWEVVRMLFLGLREFQHLNARVRYAALYILAFNGWNEAAAQIEIIHREGHLNQPRQELQGETLRLLFQVHQGLAGSH